VPGDVDGNGEVNKAEFQRAIPELGVWSKGQEVDELFDSFDTDGSGAISFRELNRMLRRTRQTDKESKIRLAGASSPSELPNVVDLGPLRAEIYKRVRTDAVHADIEASLYGPSQDELLLTMPTSPPVVFEKNFITPNHSLHASPDAVRLGLAP
jgi:hypothetical protein